MNHHTLRSAGSPIAWLRADSWLETRSSFAIVLSKVSRLDHVFNTIDIEPVTCCVQYSNWVLQFQQFLEQLGDACFAVGWFGQEFRNDAGDECGSAG